jgi:PhnB protein
MHSNPYLFFNGDCREALTFYAELLGGRVDDMMAYAGTPMAEEMPADWRDKVMHASMTFGEDTLMASDAPPPMYEKPQGFYVALHFKDTAEAERIFAALAEGGTVKMPLEETFWATRFGMCVDRFGTPWMVNCDKPTAA